MASTPKVDSGRCAGDIFDGRAAFASLSENSNSIRLWLCGRAAQLATTKYPRSKAFGTGSAFEHSASVASLEDWFNPERLRDDYVPTGYRGTGKSRAVKGHPFGLGLSHEEKTKLIAFLKSL